ncbi:MAG: STAS-like domain-containing protein [Heteroscytonema crispum UTEX LB 1556]
MNSLTQTENTVTICVTEVIGDQLCILCGDGKKVYEHIAKAFKQGKKVNLSFKNGEDITSAFLAEAFCQLYSNFPEEQIETSLRVVDIQPDDAVDLEYVISDVKDYLKDPQLFTDAVREAFGDVYE